MRTPDGQSKIAMLTGDYIFTKVRDTSFADRILTPMPVSKDEIRSGITEGTSDAVPGSINDNYEDSLYVVKEVDVEGEAMIMSLRGQPRARYVNGKRFAIPLVEVRTERFEKTQAELLASKYDLIKIIEDTAYLETHTARDEKFINYCDLAVTRSGKSLTMNGPIQRSALRSIQHQAMRDQIIPTTLLMSQIGWTDLMLWDQSDLGDTVAEVTRDGYSESKVMGLTHIKSVKSKLFDTFNDDDELSSTELWSFPEQKFLGYNLYYDDYRVWNAWEAGVWRFEGSQIIGMGFGNIKGITKLTINY